MFSVGLAVGSLWIVQASCIATLMFGPVPVWRYSYDGLGIVLELCEAVATIWLSLTIILMLSSRGGAVTRVSRHTATSDCLGRGNALHPGDDTADTLASATDRTFMQETVALD